MSALIDSSGWTELHQKKKEKIMNKIKTQTNEQTTFKTNNIKQDQTFRDASTVTLPLLACFWLQEPVLLPRISSTSSFGMIVHAMTLSIVTIP